MKARTTIKQAEDVEKYLEYARYNGQALDCISPSYLKLLDNVLKHLRVRMARGEWSSSEATAQVE